MSLADKVSEGISSTRSWFFTPTSRGEMVNYLARKDLKSYLERVPENKRTDLYKRLEHHVEQSFNKYVPYMQSWTQKAASITGMASTLSEGYQLSGLAKVALTGAQYSPLHTFMFLG